jgi:hypothetical protein
MEEEKLWLVLLLPEGVVEEEKLWLGLTEADPEAEVLCSAEGLCPSARCEQKLSSSSTGSAAWSSCRKEIMEKKKEAGCVVESTLGPYMNERRSGGWSWLP